MTVQKKQFRSPDAIQRNGFICCLRSSRLPAPCSVRSSEDGRLPEEGSRYLMVAMREQMRYCLPASPIPPAKGSPAPSIISGVSGFMLSINSRPHGWWRGSWGVAAVLASGLFIGMPELAAGTWQKLQRRQRISSRNGRHNLRSHDHNQLAVSLGLLHRLEETCLRLECLPERESS